MQSSTSRLWKQIGSQSFDRPTPIKQYNKYLKNENQQILSFGDNAPVKAVNQIQMLRTKGHHGGQINSLIQKSTKHFLDSENFRNRIMSFEQRGNQSTQSQNEEIYSFECQCQRNYVRVAEIFKSVLCNLKNQFNLFQTKIKAEILKAKTDQQNFKLSMKALQKICLDNMISSRKKIENQNQQIRLLRILKQQQQEILQKYESQIKQNNKQKKQKQADFKNLFEQFSKINNQKHTLAQENSQMSEKIFQLQQKLLRFDLQVSEKAQKLCLQIYNIKQQQQNLRKSLSSDLFKINNQWDKNKKRMSTSRNLTLPSDHNQQEKLTHNEACQDRILSDIRARKAQMNQKTIRSQIIQQKIQRPPQRKRNQLRKLLSKDLSQTYLQNQYKSQVNYQKNQNIKLNNFNKSSKLHQANNFYNQKQKVSSHLTTCQQSKKSSLLYKKKAPEIYQISQKLQKIKQKIQYQIYNIKVTKNSQ